MKSFKAFRFLIIILALFVFDNIAYAMVHDTFKENIKKQETKTEKKKQETTSSKKSTQTTKKNTTKKNTKQNTTKTPRKQSSYNTLENWNLSENNPSVTLKKANGDTLRLRFEIQGRAFILPDYQQAIPAHTRFTVPGGYYVFGSTEDTKRIEGKAQRVDYSGNVTKHQFFPSSEVEYTSASGLIIISCADYDNKNYLNTNLAKLSSTTKSITPQKTINHTENKTETKTVTNEIVSTKKKIEFDNRSIKPEDVINKYDLPDDHKNSLIFRHNEALKLKSKETRVEKYSEIFRDYPKDYLAAYYVALAEFESDHGGSSVYWCEQALKINPLYLPAKQLMKKAKGLI